MTIKVSMSDLFPECSRVLDNELVPLHYKGLASKAIQSMGLDTNDVNMFRVIEDVREKMVSKGRLGTFYTGSPNCLVAKKQWFKMAQLPLLRDVDAESIEIPGSVDSGVGGAFEALMRSPYMMRKTAASTERLNMGRARGLVLEHHVSDWFRRNWPNLFVEADNKGTWQAPCPHDFRLSMGNRLIDIDIAGTSLSGGYRRSKYKASVDIHLLCSVAGDSALWQGVVTGENYDGEVMPETALSPAQMIVWMNCRDRGVDYESVKTCALKV